MAKKRLILIVVAIAVLIAGYIIYLTLGRSDKGDLTRGALTITELKAQDLSGRQIRVKGEVAAGSIRWGPRERVMKFSLTDGQQTLEARYPDVVSDYFKPGAKLVIEGSYNPSGIFEARSISSGTSRLCAVCH